MKQFNYIQFLFDYGTLFVLALFCAWFSYVTIEEQSPTSSAAAERLAKRASLFVPGSFIVQLREMLPPIIDPGLDLLFHALFGWFVKPALGP